MLPPSARRSCAGTSACRWARNTRLLSEQEYVDEYGSKVKSGEVRVDGDLDRDDDDG